eukprot:3623449-Rhodomonas_salina.1
MKEGSSGEHTSFADRKMRLHPARVGCSSTYQNPRACVEVSAHVSASSSWVWCVRVFLGGGGLLGCLCARE